MSSSSSSFFLGRRARLRFMSRNGQKNLKSALTARLTTYLAAQRSFCFPPLPHEPTLDPQGACMRNIFSICSPYNSAAHRDLPVDGLSTFAMLTMHQTVSCLTLSPQKMAAKAPRRVFVVGVGMTKFEKPGRREGWDYPDMVQEAGTKALKDAGIDYKEIQQVTVGYVYGDSTCGQRAVYSLGLTGVPVYNVNNNCSTGSTALFMARNLIAGGLADCVLAVGFEKMERGSLQAKWTDRTNPLDQHMNVMSEARGITAAPFAPQMFGNAGVEHMEKYGSKPEHMAKIAWKNHKHSGLNPYSQFQDEYSVEQILKSPKVFGPLTKLQCCPTSDGAAAAVIASEEFVRRHGLEAQAVEIAGMSLATDLASSFQEKSCIKMVGFDMSKKAAEEAYAQAGIRPTDAQVVELHDCFSANELVTYEAIGLARQGEAHKLVDAGDTTYGGKWVVNPSGGLISKGHPLGATGLAQCAELTWQLRRMCGKRQVPNAKYAIQHNIGLGGAAVVSVYRLGFPDKFRALPADMANPALDASAVPRTKAAGGAAPAAAAPKAAPTAAPAAAPAKAAGGAGSNFKSAMVFAELGKRIAADASLVKKVNGVYLFKIQAGSESASWTVDLKNGNGSVAAGAGEKADCTITMQDQDFVDLITGKLNGQQAFVQGKLKIQGNMALAMKLSLLSAGPKASL